MARPDSALPNLPPDRPTAVHQRRPSVRYLPVLAGSLMLAGTLTGLTGLAPASAATMACKWTDGNMPPPLTTGGSFKSVTVPSATEAWAAGSTTDSHQNQHALIERWNGSAWTVARIPRLRSSSLLSIRSLSPTSIWAVGTVSNASHQDRTLILHWNGKTWTQQKSPNPGSFDELQGVRAVSATNAWAVGESSSGGPKIRSLILHWNGNTWKQVTSPNPTLNNQFAGVATISASSAWAVGLVSSSTDAPRLPALSTRAGVKTDPRTFLARWNGRTWSRTASPSPGKFDSLAAVGVTSATNAWAVGTTGPGGIERTLILHWGGKAWKQTPSPNPAGSGTDNELNGVTATSAGNAWAAGDSDDGGFVAHSDGHRWQTVAGPILHTDLSSVAASSASNAWAVGSIAVGDTTQPLAFRCMPPD